MTPMPLGLFVEKLQPKVDLAGNDILFTYFVVEANSKKAIIISSINNKNIFNIK